MNTGSQLMLSPHMENQIQVFLAVMYLTESKTMPM